MNTNIKRESQEYGFGRYFILTALLSFVGWAWEVLVMRVQTGKFYNQGFMTLPFCPIYGCSLLVAYLVLGTPDHGRGILKGVKTKSTRYALYFAFAFIIPTIAELLVGAVLDRGLHLTLWSYSSLPMNYKGYVCLPISLVWSGLIFLFMKFVFPYLYRFIRRIPKGLAGAIAFSLCFIFLIDFSLNVAFLIYRQ